MEETIENILERVKYEKIDLFKKLIRSCIHVSTHEDLIVHEEHDSLVFKMDAFFKGFPDFINEFGKDKKYISGVHALSIIFDELGLEVDDQECFILFHIRGLGKFRMKESKLHDELKNLWHGHYKEFELTPNDFSYSLKNLMRSKIINYRKGNLSLNPSVLLRYR